MNRKNLTAAVLAGLAGIAGIAGTAQAVNLNPDGLGQVLIYPYYTTNGGNDTLLSVVNTTDSAKAVKVRFLEGYNSREVLDFNLYLSPNDVWVAAITDDAGAPTLIIPDDSCTVPYLYGDFDGKQAFLSLAYNDHSDADGNVVFTNDGGPTGIARAAEGYFEMIEMGTVTEFLDVDEEIPNLTYLDITHRFHFTLDDDDEVIDELTYWGPGGCDQLVKNWTRLASGAPDGMWTFEGDENIDISRNSGGLFGGAAIVNTENGTMYSYNAQAIQGYDKSDGKRHEEPGTINPSLNDGDQHRATVFFGVPSNRAVDIWYPRSVGAVSAIFMHENIMNEYTLDADIGASTEWVVTFPTKNWYVDPVILADVSVANTIFWEPDQLDPGCGGWMPGDWHPLIDQEGLSDPNPVTGWERCTFISIESTGAIPPFTEVFDGSACETVGLQTWDRNEQTFNEERGGFRPPVVSPSLPPDCDSELEFCAVVEFQLCYEVNVLRFGDGVIFGTPEIEDSSLLLSVTPASGPDEDGFENGWGRISFNTSGHKDRAGLIGLPVTGFAAFEFENSFVGDDDVKAFYGGLFGHRGNVRRGTPLCRQCSS